MTLYIALRLRNRPTGCEPSKLNDVLDAELPLCSLVTVQALAVGLPELGNLAPALTDLRWRSRFRGSLCSALSHSVGANSQTDVQNPCNKRLRKPDGGNEHLGKAFTGTARGVRPQVLVVTLLTSSWPRRAEESHTLPLRATMLC